MPWLHLLLSRDLHQNDHCGSEDYSIHFDSPVAKNLRREPHECFDLTCRHRTAVGPIQVEAMLAMNIGALNHTAGRCRHPTFGHVAMGMWMENWGRRTRRTRPKELQRGVRRCGTVEICSGSMRTFQVSAYAWRRVTLGRNIHNAELTTSGYAKTRRLAAVPFRLLASIRSATFAIDEGEPTTWQKVVS